METSEQQRNAKLGGEINYYVLAGIFIAIVIFDIINAIEPQIDAEVDFFELTRLLGFGAASGFAFWVAKRYGKSKVFGRAYLFLAIGYAFYFMGDLLWYVYQAGYQVSNPYPYWPDIGYLGFYPFAIYHLRTNVQFFKRKLNRNQKLLLIILPAGITLIYIFALLFTFSVDESIAGNPSLVLGEDEQTTTFRLLPYIFTHMTVQLPMEQDQQFWNAFYMGIAYVAATTLTFTYAILGAQVFRGSLLGAPWGLLLLGIGLNWFADIHYYYSSIYYFDRTNPVHGIWLASTMVICYALYKHRKL